MLVKCTLKDREDVKEVSLDVNKNITIKELYYELYDLDVIRCDIDNFLPQLQLNDHYKIMCPRDLWHGVLYIISDGKVLWEPSYDISKVADYFDTYDIKDHSMTILHGSELEIGNGSYVPELIELWDIIINVIECLPYLSAEFKQYAIDILKHYKGIGKLTIYPDSLFNFLLSLLSKREVTIKEFSRITGTDETIAEVTIKTSGAASKGNIFYDGENIKVFIGKFDSANKKFLEDKNNHI